MERNDAFYKTFPVVWIITIIAGALLWILGSQKMGISFILGSVTSLMMMSSLHRSSKSITELTSQIDAQRKATKNYFFRYGFYALILITSAVHPNLDVIFTAIGLFVFKLVLYIISFIDSRGEINGE